MLSGTQIISTSHEWQVGISLTFFFHFIYFLDFRFISDLLHYKWEMCIPNMTVYVLIFSKFSINEDRIWYFQQRILQNINVFSKISKESTSFYHIHEQYSVSSTFLYNGNSKCYVVRIVYAISFQWSKFLSVILCDVDMIWVPDSICCPDSRLYGVCIHWEWLHWMHNRIME